MRTQGHDSARTNSSGVQPHMGELQLLLGNVGRPGGGIMALRRHSTIRGATDLSTLYDTLPGYLPIRPS